MIVQAEGRCPRHGDAAACPSEALVTPSGAKPCRLVMESGFAYLRTLAGSAGAGEVIISWRRSNMLETRSFRCDDAAIMAATALAATRGRDADVSVVLASGGEDQAVIPVLRIYELDPARKLDDLARASGLWADFLAPTFVLGTTEGLVALWVPSQPLSYAQASTLRSLWSRVWVDRAAGLNGLGLDTDVVVHAALPIAGTNDHGAAPPRVITTVWMGAAYDADQLVSVARSAARPSTLPAAHAPATSIEAAQEAKPSSDEAGGSTSGSTTPIAGDTTVGADESTWPRGPDGSLDWTAIAAEGARAEERKEVRRVPPKRPRLRDEAMWGPHGDLVTALHGHHEAADIGVLMSLLAHSGALLAGAAHFNITGSPHGPNVFVLLIGESASARKSTALGVAETVFRGSSISPGAPELGLGACEVRHEEASSGERLIRLWAPSVPKSDAEGESPGPVWPGRRTLCVVPEASTIFKKASGDSSILGEVFCQIWDQMPLRHKAMSSGDVDIPADRYLMGFLGATTDHVAQATITAAGGLMVLSGFGNRFLPTFLPTSDVHLPDADLDEHDIAAMPAVAEFRRRLAWRGLDEETGFGMRVRWSDPARELWREHNQRLKEPKGSTDLLRVLKGRGANQVMRLALNLDLTANGESVFDAGVSLPALRAALAIWDYVDESIDTLFSTGTGDRDMDQLLAYLRDEGQPLKMEDFKKLFHQKAYDLVEKAQKKGIVITATLPKDVRAGRPLKVVGLPEWMGGPEMKRHHPGRLRPGIWRDLDWTRG
jgi:hypothetical protein